MEIVGFWISLKTSMALRNFWCLELRLIHGIQYDKGIEGPMSLKMEQLR